MDGRQKVVSGRLGPWGEPSLQVKLRVIVVLELVVDLNTPPMGIRDDQSPPVVVKDDSHGQRQAPLRLQCVGPPTCLDDVGAGIHHPLHPFGQMLGVTDEASEETSVGGKQLHPIVGPVADVDIAVWVYGDVGGVTKLPPAGTVRAELDDELAIRTEFLHAMVLVVGDVDIPLAVDGYTPR